MSIKNQIDLAKERFGLVYSIAPVIHPIIVFALLMYISNVMDGDNSKLYFALGVVTFGFMFPGKLHTSESFFSMINKTLINWLTIILVLFFIGYKTDYIHYYNQEVLINWAVSSPLLMIAINGFAQQSVEWLYSLRQSQRNVIFVGCSSVGINLSQQIHENKSLGMKCIGFFDDRSASRINSDLKSKNLSIAEDNLLGNFSYVADFCKKNDVKQVYICIPISQQPRIMAFLNDLKDTTTSIYFVPDIFVADPIQSRLNHIDGIPVVALCETPLIGIRAIQKRVFDFVFALAVLILLSPIMTLIALVILLTSPGPIVFVQSRYGLDGKRIDVYKFRTMNVMEDGNSSYTQVMKNDVRVTPFGAFLRKTSLDELPQFINVLQGRMSVVGPRPHVVSVNENYRKLIPGYMIRHKVRPGITGWAQINGYRGGDDLVHMQGRIEYDLEYLKKWSIALDFLIVAKTALVFLAGDKKAY